MAAAKLVALLLLVALVFNFTTCVFADAGINGREELKLRSDGGQIELDQLNAKIRALGYTQNLTVTSIFTSMRFRENLRAILISVFFFFGLVKNPKLMTKPRNLKGEKN